MSAQRESASAALAPEIRARWSIPEASLAPLPALFDGTERVGSLAVDAQGRFRPTQEARQLFDYFFLARGLEPVPVIRGRVIAEILARLPESARPGAVDALDRYVALLERLEGFAAGAIPDEPRAELDALRALRREVLGPALADAFYGEDEYVIELEIARREVAQDPTLDAVARAARLAELDARLPEPILRARREAEAPLRVREQVAALRARGASDAEVFTLREREFGRAAAERLRALDERRAAWNERFAAYREQRDALLALPGSSEQSSARLDALRRGLFSEAELARVRAQDEDELAPSAPLPPTPAVLSVP